MAKGGKREGAGRKKGSITKPRFSDYVSESDVEKLVKKAMELAKNGDTTMLKFVLEHQFGKAMQPVEGNLTGNFSLSFDNTFKDVSSSSS